MENETIKVLVVDDSRVYRETIKKIFEGFLDVEISGTTCNGLETLEFLRNNEMPDLITLDVEMPEMDGLETLNSMMQMCKNGEIKQMPLVLMISSITREGAKATISAIQNGAFDFITKPITNDNIENERILSAEIGKRLDMVRKKVKGKCTENCINKNTSFTEQPTSKTNKLNAIVIGSSTGGLKSVVELLPALCSAIETPIFLTTSLASDFLSSLIDKLNIVCSNKVRIAENNEPMEKNRVYVAPADRHLIVRKISGKFLVGISDSPPENNARPSLCVLLRSLNMAMGGDFMLVFLAGCGADGIPCLARLKRSGAYILAQNHTDSGICEMPSAAISTGTVDLILPLEEMPGQIQKIINR